MLGDAYLEPAECLQVAEFIIAESANLSRPLDMRILVIGFADRLQAEDCDAGCNWQDLVGSLLRGHPTVAGDVEAVGIREQTKARELAIAREIGAVRAQEPIRCLEGEDGEEPGRVVPEIGGTWPNRRLGSISREN